MRGLIVLGIVYVVTCVIILILEKYDDWRYEQEWQSYADPNHEMHNVYMLVEGAKKLGVFDKKKVFRNEEERRIYQEKLDALIGKYGYKSNEEDIICHYGE